MTNRRRDFSETPKAKAKVAGQSSNVVRETITRNPAPELDLSQPWHLVLTAPAGEAKAKRGLEEAGCSVFWPSYRKLITKGERVMFDRDVSTFPGYLFAAGPLFASRTGAAQAHIATVNGKPVTKASDIDGIIRVHVGSDGWHVTVPAQALLAVAAYQSAQEPVKPASELPRLSVGDQVIIRSGPFMDFAAVMVEAIGLAKAKVAIEGLGGLVEIGVEQLEAA